MDAVCALRIALVAVLAGGYAFLSYAFLFL
jgi:hypothetical protein